MRHVGPVVFNHDVRRSQRTRLNQTLVQCVEPGAAHREVEHAGVEGPHGTKHHVQRLATTDDVTRGREPGKISAKTDRILHRDVGHRPLVAQLAHHLSEPSAQCLWRLDGDEVLIHEIPSSHGYCAHRRDGPTAVRWNVSIPGGVYFASSYEKE